MVKAVLEQALGSTCSKEDTGGPAASVVRSHTGRDGAGRQCLARCLQCEESWLVGRRLWNKVEERRRRKQVAAINPP